MIRIGTTSCVLPDDILPNVRYLATQVEDIELVLFESEEISNLPSNEVIGELKRICVEHNLTYTVHFPLDLEPGSADANKRRRWKQQVLRIIELTRSLPVFGYVLHLPPDRIGATPSDDVNAWHSYLEESLSALANELPIDPSKICVETLAYPFDLVEDLVEQYGFSVTLDVGHLWLMGYDAVRATERLLKKTRICHLHGVKEGHDHLGLESGDQEAVRAFLEALSRQCRVDGRDRVLTVEVFSPEHLRSSLPIVRAGGWNA